ncbi:hypothetical protein [Salinibacter ruber]|uniref:Uncharacterized protein n=1 Tax=Salinibacter ruber TaxID=146919 RepID=A0AAW5P7Q8_9BACT|nr:hypothetical protein [Salinibacter ruber]MCS4157970.1 hypothetical protein [Salinibacter ruber]
MRKYIYFLLAFIIGFRIEDITPISISGISLLLFLEVYVVKKKKLKKKFLVSLTFIIFFSITYYLSVTFHGLNSSWSFLAKMTTMTSAFIVGYISVSSTSKNNAKLIIASLCLGSALTACYHLYYYVLYYGFVNIELATGGRTLQLNNVVIVGTNIDMFAAFSTSALVSLVPYRITDMKGGLLFFLVSVVSGLAGLVSILVSGGRMGIIAFVLSILVSLLFRYLLLKRKILNNLATFLLIAVTAYPTWIYLKSEGFLASLYNEGLRTSRFGDWIAIIQNIGDVLSGGQDVTLSGSAPHNLFLDVVWNGGVLAAICLLLPVSLSALSITKKMLSEKGHIQFLAFVAVLLLVIPAMLQPMLDSFMYIVTFVTGAALAISELESRK